MKDFFFTLAKESESLYKEKGSKFIAIACRVDSIEEIKIKLEELRKSYYDARHHCYAYILGQEGQQVRANDDGEPNHSAGDPILGQIKSKKLTNTLVVVVRYFGGTKLGVSGLINAYKTAAEQALTSNKITKEDITDTLTFTFDYHEMNVVMKMVKELDINIIDQGYKEKSELKATILVSKTEQLQNRVELLNNTGHDITLKIL
jgi:uncharacterized YigZ family protein